MKKILGIVVLGLLLSGNVNAEQIVFKNCFKPDFDTYGKEYNFKSYLKDYNAGETIDAEILVDEVVRVDTDKKKIYHTTIWKDETKFEKRYNLAGFKDNIYIGKVYNDPNHATSDVWERLGPKYIYIFIKTGEVRIKFLKAKKVAYKFVCSGGSGNSTLRSILKMLR